MEEENRYKSCAYCGNFQRYYTKGVRRFAKTDHGYCKLSKQIVCCKESCGCWKSAAKHKVVLKRAASRALYEMFIDISAIRQIFEEDAEERDRLP